MRRTFAVSGILKGALSTERIDGLAADASPDIDGW